jgi:hypothetical protein
VSTLGLVLSRFMFELPRILVKRLMSSHPALSATVVSASNTIHLSQWMVVDGRV